MSRRNNPMIVLHHLVQLPDGSRELRDFLVDAEAAAEKVRSAIEAVECLDRLERGEAITAEHFADRTVQILVGIEKRGRGVPDRNSIQLYRAAPVSLHHAAE